MFDIDNHLASVVNEHACVLELFLDRIVFFETALHA